MEATVKLSREDTAQIQSAIIQAITDFQIEKVKPFMTITEVCELLSINRKTFDKYFIKQGLKVYSFGRQYRIGAKDLEAFMENTMTDYFPEY